MKIKIEHNNNLYEITPNEGVSISIPMNFNDDDNPKFYDDNNPKKEFYTNNGIEYKEYADFLVNKMFRSWTAR